jgi:hypothetical protein
LARYFIGKLINKKDKNKKNVIFKHGSITFVKRLFNSMTFGDMLIITKAIFIRKSENCVILLAQEKKRNETKIFAIAD